MDTDQTVSSGSISPQRQDMINRRNQLLNTDTQPQCPTARISSADSSILPPLFNKEATHNSLAEFYSQPDQLSNSTGVGFKKADSSINQLLRHNGSFSLQGLQINKQSLQLEISENFAPNKPTNSQPLGSNLGVLFPSVATGFPKVKAPPPAPLPTPKVLTSNQKKELELCCYFIVTCCFSGYFLKFFPISSNNILYGSGLFGISVCIANIVRLTCWNRFASVFFNFFRAPKPVTTNKPLPLDAEPFVNLQLQGNGSNKPITNNPSFPYFTSSIQGTAIPAERKMNETSNMPFSEIFNPNPPQATKIERAGILSQLGSIKKYMTSSFIPPTQTSKEGPRMVNGQTVFSSQQTLDLINCTKDHSSIALRTRIWIASKILRPLSETIVSVDKKFNSLKLHYLNSSSSQYCFEPALKQYPSLTGDNQPRNLIELYQSNPQDSHIISRLKIERYINVTGYNNKDYIIKRIHDFAQKGIARYCWDSGNDTNWIFKSWNPALPTDSELLLHLFITFMDFHSGTRHLDSFNFSKNHFCTKEEKIHQGIFIKQISSRPPHYVVVDNNTVYELPEGEQNLFLAIYVFTYLVFRYHRGYISATSLANPNIGLDILVE